MSLLTVDNELYQRVAEAAAAQGKTVDEFVGEAGASIDCQAAIHLLVPRYLHAGSA